VPVKVTPEQFQEKHARRLKGALPDIMAGIDKVTIAPGEQAAKKVDKLRARWLAKVDDGTWAARTKAVPLEEWKAKAKSKISARLALGIDEAKDKVLDFARQLLPFQDALLPKIHAMPDITLEDSVNRAATWIREMAKFKKK